MEQKYEHLTEFNAVCKMMNWNSIDGEVRVLFTMGYGPDQDKFVGTKYLKLKDPEDEEKIISTEIIETNIRTINFKN